MTVPSIYPNDGFCVVNEIDWKKLKEDSAKLKQLMEQDMNVDKVNEQLDQAAQQPATKDKWDELAAMLRSINPDKCAVLFMDGTTLECFADNTTTNKADVTEMLLMGSLTAMGM